MVCRRQFDRSKQTSVRGAARRFTPRLSGIALAALLAFAGPLTHAEERIADVRQGTNLSLAITPDGSTLVVGLLGRLWQLPASGGGATPLTPATERARHPRVSPDGTKVVYQRHLEGRWTLWLLDLADHSRVALTDGPYNDREPDFMPDGTAIVFASDRGGQYGLWRLDMAAGHVISRLTAEPGDASFPAVSERGEIAYLLAHNGRWQLKALTPTGSTAQLHDSAYPLSVPSWRPGGGVIIFNEHQAGRATFSHMLILADPPLLRQLSQGEDVFASRAAWLSAAEYLYTADGQIWRRGLAQIARRPVHLNAAVAVPAYEPPLIRTVLDAVGPHAARGHAGQAISADGQRRVFAALGDLWLQDAGAPLRQLTDDIHLYAHPALSADDLRVAFASDRDGSLNLWLMDLDSQVTQQLTTGTGKHFDPAISPGGGQIAFLHTQGLGPWAPATLQIMALTDTTGTRRTLADDLIDAEAVRWSADGGRIGVVARTAAAGSRDLLWFDAVTGSLLSSEPPPEPPDWPNGSMAIEWHQPGAAAYVVQAGRVFDGVRGDYLRHMDIHVQGQRITAIVGRDMLPLPDRVIDATDLTVLPGLIDLHAHQSVLTGERLGRIWLAWGITTVRELTTRLPEALERSESWASGRRPGPRLIVNPAAAISTVSTNGIGFNVENDYPIVVQQYAGIADGLGHSLSAQAHMLRITPGHQPVLPATLQHWRGRPDDLHAIEISPLSFTYQDVLSTTIASGTVLTPNLGALGGLNALGSSWRSAVSDPAFAALYPASERDLWLSTDAAVNGSLHGLQNKVAEVVRGGGRISAGTGAPAVPYGLGLHAELALLVRAGIPNDQVLRIATAQAALALGLEDQIGTLEPGRLADFIVIDGNPLERIEDIGRITAVVKGGQWMERTALWQAPAIAAQAPGRPHDDTLRAWR